MKQTFVIESKRKIDADELLGMLEDSDAGTKWTVSEITVEKKAKALLKTVGLLYNDSKEINQETAIVRAGGFKKGVEYMERTPKHGDRAWLIKGKKKDIVVWDTGNGWCQIIKEIEVKK